jgi:glycosyltransferase involved in cell wall biosynthesis
MKLVLSGNEPRQEYLFAELRRMVDVVGEVPFDHIDPVTKYLAAALSYASPREEWWGNYHMHPLVQRRRRKVLNRGMQRLRESPDALLMWGSWFNPHSGARGGVRFFNYIDQSRSLQPLPEERPAKFSRRRRSYELQVDTYRDSSGILCMSEWCRNQTLEAHPAVDTRKVITVGWGPCGVDLSGEDLPEEKREPIVLHVSNDFYRKGVDFILETAPKVRRAVPNARFLVIGKDSSGMALTPVEGVEVTGPIRDKKALSDYFRRASVFFLPHRFDRSPHVLAEAMSAGLPIVTSAQGGPIEVTQGTGVGFLHPIGDTDGYAESLIHILRDPQLRAAMGSKARALMSSRYNWKSVAARILAAAA